MGQLILVSFLQAISHLSMIQGSYEQQKHLAFCFQKRRAKQATGQINLTFSQAFCQDKVTLHIASCLVTGDLRNLSFWNSNGNP
jgi:hypothetical protein